MSDNLQANGPTEANRGVGLSLEVGDDGVAVIEFDQPGTDYNRFTPEVLERLVALVGEVREFAASGRVRGVVICSAKRDSFIVGMDVATMAGIREADVAAAGARQGQRAFALLAALPVTTVAAINGTCLGGATELALACDVRVAADSRAVQIGLPEVNLGIIPGFGGTQRLPRTIALERALPMILTGRALDARRAHRAGLVDAVVPAEMLLAEARRRAQQPPPPPGRRCAPEDRSRLRRLRRAALEGNPLGRALLFRKAAAGVRAATGGHYPAPAAALEVVRRGLRLPLEQGLELEARKVGELLVGAVARNLMGIFFLRQAARRKDAVAQAEPVRRLGVLGAGVMGGGIAQVAASQGVVVRIKDIAIEPLEHAMAEAHKRLDRRRKRGRMSRREVRHAMGRILPTLRYDGLRRADLVVEAVVEKLEVKHQVLAEVESAVGPDTVLATNTSSLTLAAMATALRDPGRFVGLHFFNPVHRMPLVEVVRGPQSRPEAVARVVRFAIDLGKVPVVVGDAPGFFVNRVLAPYMNEALLLLQEGASVAGVDRALRRFGMPMGPFRLLDEVGLDVSVKVAGNLAGVLGERVPQAEAGARLLERGRLGRKSGAGFYLYAGKGKPAVDEALERELGGGRRDPDAEVIVDRCVLVMLNEACRALAAGVVSSPLAGDLAVVMGTGFAPFRGGIFRWAETRGLAEVVGRMQQFAERFGERFVPAPLLVRHAEHDQPFYEGSWPRKIEAL